MRIHEAAKQYNLTNDDLLALLKRAGFDVSNHMTGMTFDMVEAVERFTRPKGKAKAKRKSKAKAKATTADAGGVKATLIKKKPVVKEPVAVAEPEPATVKKAAAKKVAAKKATPKATATKTTAKAQSAAAKATPAEVSKAHDKATPPVKAKSIAPDADLAAKAMDRAKRPAGKEKPQPKAPEAKPAKPAKSAKPAVGTPAPSKPAKRGRREGPTTDAQQKAVRESVRRTLAKMETTRRTKRRKGKPRAAEVPDGPSVKVTDGVTVRELAETLKLEPQELIKRCLDLGMPVTISQSLDKDVVELITEDIGVHIQFASDEIEDMIKVDTQVDPERLTSRAPIVTVMGHVDHGKTSILDFIRKSRVASGEAGGITQHVGAYQVSAPNGDVTFIDTPGHEAFTSMRARGAKVTDIVVLVVAADDGVMPQTIEAINHARAAEVPVIVAVNKMDLPGANPAQIKQQLTEHELVVEDFGGEVVAVELSAKTGDGVDKLLEMILLQAEIMELVADPEATAQAVAVEVRKEEGRGILTTVLVTQGQLRIGDPFVIGSTSGKIRALQDHSGRAVKVAGPGEPVVILGLDGVPEAGDTLTVVRNEKNARELGERRAELARERERKSAKKLTLEELYSQIQEGELKELRLIVKGDTNGSVEALTQSLLKLELDEVGIRVIHSGVGVVSESDVLLASSSNALIIGFSVKVSTKAAELAEKERVEIKTYSIIYEVISDVDAAVKGMLDPVEVEKTLGRAQVRKVYKISRLGQIAGSMVTEGLITRNASARVLRNEELIHEGRITSLKRFQEDVREVQKDFECGIGIGSFSGLEEGDVIEVFVIEQHARVL